MSIMGIGASLLGAIGLGGAGAAAGGAAVGGLGGSLLGGASTAGGLGSLGGGIGSVLGAAGEGAITPALSSLGGAAPAAAAPGTAGAAAAITPEFAGIEGGLMNTQSASGNLMDATKARLSQSMNGGGSQRGSSGGGVSMPGGNEPSPALINGMMNQYQQKKPYDPFEDPRIRSLMNLGRF